MNQLTNLLLQAKLNHIPKNEINQRIDEVLELIELSDKQHQAVVTYSGGMRKRLDIAGGLLHHPKVLFLDEPTVGLDIQTRRKIWEYIKKIHIEFEMTIFVTTHYMEEADNLCDRIGIIDGGKIQVIDSPQNMKNALGNEIISLVIEKNNNYDSFLAELKNIEFIKNDSIYWAHNIKAECAFITKDNIDSLLNKSGASSTMVLEVEPWELKHLSTTRKRNQ